MQLQVATPVKYVFDLPVPLLAAGSTPLYDVVPHTGAPNRVDVGHNRRYATPYNQTRFACGRQLIAMMEKELLVRRPELLAAAAALFDAEFRLAHVIPC